MIPDITAVTNRFGSTEKNLLVFRLGAQVFAISIEYVVQIIPMLRLTSLPQADPSIEGVANIHGTITPIINVRHRLGMRRIAPHLQTPIILIRVSTRLMGFMVDEVIDVLSLPANQVARPNAILPEGIETSPVLEGVVFIENHTILILDPQILLSEAGLQSQLMQVIDREFEPDSSPLMNIEPIEETTENAEPQPASEHSDRGGVD